MVKHHKQLKVLLHVQWQALHTQLHGGVERGVLVVPVIDGCVELHGADRVLPLQTLGHRLPLGLTVVLAEDGSDQTNSHGGAPGGGEG